jgi:hypothetical protein
MNLYTGRPVTSTTHHVTPLGARWSLGVAFVILL